jgi:DNA-binding PadR family transcriptional regulator
MYTLYEHFDAIINYLGDHPGSTAKQIIEHFHSNEKKIKQAQIYNIIKDMIKKKILVKNQ